MEQLEARRSHFLKLEMYNFIVRNMSGDRHQRSSDKSTKISLPVLGRTTFSVYLFLLLATSIASCPVGWMPPDCIQCLPGYFGINCSLICPATCFNGSCEPENGSCYSCKVGFTGLNCSFMCQAGTFGQNCSMACPRTCYRKQCDPVTGLCKRCVPGYEGPRCDAHYTHRSHIKQPPKDIITEEVKSSQHRNFIIYTVTGTVSGIMLVIAISLTVYVLRLKFRPGRVSRSLQKDPPIYINSKVDIFQNPFHRWRGPTTGKHFQMRELEEEYDNNEDNYIKLYTSQSIINKDVRYKKGFNSFILNSRYCSWCFGIFSAGKTKKDVHDDALDQDEINIPELNTILQTNAPLKLAKAANYSRDLFFKTYLHNQTIKADTDAKKAGATGKKSYWKSDRPLKQISFTGLDPRKPSGAVAGKLVAFDDNQRPKYDRAIHLRSNPIPDAELLMLNELEISSKEGHSSSRSFHLIYSHIVQGLEPQPPRCVTGESCLVEGEGRDIFETKEEQHKIQTVEENFNYKSDDSNGELAMTAIIHENKAKVYVETTEPLVESGGFTRRLKRSLSKILNFTIQSIAQNLHEHAAKDQVVNKMSSTQSEQAESNNLEKNTPRITYLYSGNPEEGNEKSEKCITRKDIETVMSKTETCKGTPVVERAQPEPDTMFLHLDKDVNYKKKPLENLNLFTKVSDADDSNINRHVVSVSGKERHIHHTSPCITNNKKNQPEFNIGEHKDTFAEINGVSDSESENEELDKMTKYAREANVWDRRGKRHSSVASFVKYNQISNKYPTAIADVKYSKFTDACTCSYEIYPTRYYHQKNMRNAKPQNVCRKTKHSNDLIGTHEVPFSNDKSPQIKLSIREGNRENESKKYSPFKKRTRQTPVCKGDARNPGTIPKHRVSIHQSALNNSTYLIFSDMAVKVLTKSRSRKGRPKDDIKKAKKKTGTSLTVNLFNAFNSRLQRAFQNETSSDPPRKSRALPHSNSLFPKGTAKTSREDKESETKRRGRRRKPKLDICILDENPQGTNPGGDLAESVSLIPKSVITMTTTKSLCREIKAISINKFTTKSPNGLESAEKKQRGEEKQTLIDNAINDLCFKKSDTLKEHVDIILPKDTAASNTGEQETVVNKMKTLQTPDHVINNTESEPKCDNSKLKVNDLPSQERCDHGKRGIQGIQEKKNTLSKSNEDAPTCINPDYKLKWKNKFLPTVLEEPVGYHQRSPASSPEKKILEAVSSSPLSHPKTVLLKSSFKNSGAGCDVENSTQKTVEYQLNITLTQANVVSNEVSHITLTCGGSSDSSFSADNSSKSASIIPPLQSETCVDHSRTASQIYSSTFSKNGTEPTWSETRASVSDMTCSMKVSSTQFYTIEEDLSERFYDAFEEVCSLSHKTYSSPNHGSLVNAADVGPSNFTSPENKVNLGNQENTKSFILGEDKFEVRPNLKFDIHRSSKKKRVLGSLPAASQDLTISNFDQNQCGLKNLQDTVTNRIQISKMNASENQFVTGTSNVASAQEQSVTSQQSFDW